MRTVLMITAALGLLAVSAPGALAQKLDANGRCHAKDGKFAKAEVCKGAAPATADASGYKLDAKGNCHDPKGKMAKKAMCQR